MVAVGILFGATTVLVGLFLCTNRMEAWHRRRSQPPTPIMKLRPQPPPFRISAAQCVDCGSDDEPLSIDTHQCFVCFGVSHANG